MNVKIKNSAQSISPDIAIMLMCSGILIACPLRIFQMIKNMDPATGFFLEPSILTTIFYGILTVVSLAIIVLTFFSAKIPAALAPVGRRVILAVFSLGMAAAFCYDAICNYIPQKNTTATIVQNAQSLSKLHYVHMVFAFLACIYFLVFAASYFVGKNIHKKLKILSLAPLAWSIVKVLEKISVIISIVRVSELLLELFACVFLMLFFMTFARNVSDVNSKGTMWSAIACGAVSVLFILTYSVPRFMLTFTGNEDKLVSGYPLNYTEVACAIFILMFIITILRSGYDAEEVKLMNDELEEEAEAEKAAAEAKAAEAAKTEEEKTDSSVAKITPESVTEPETELSSETEEFVQDDEFIQEEATSQEEDIPAEDEDIVQEEDFSVDTEASDEEETAEDKAE